MIAGPACARLALVVRGPKKLPTLVTVLQALVQDATAGDPLGGTRWTRKTLRLLAKQLKRKGLAVSHETVRRLLVALDYSLRTNRKRQSKKVDRKRDRQMRLIQHTRRRFLKAKRPVISLDTKKKELIGNFKNAGRT